jgi:cyclase family protein
MIKFIDLSVSVGDNDSEPSKFKHTRLTSSEGAKELAQKAGIPISSFPNNEFLTLDTYTLSTHMGTHVDAPIHFGDSENVENINTKSVDQLPLEWFYGKGKVLNFSKFPRKKNIEKEDIVKVLEKEKIEIKPNDIVLVYTDMDKLYGTKEYFTDGPGMSKEATEFLLDLGVKVIGIDSYGFDRSFPVMLNEFKITGNRNVLWPSHFVGRTREYVHIEKLCNLDKLPKEGFLLSLFPIKLDKADAAWVRAIAIVEE